MAFILMNPSRLTPFVPYNHTLLCSWRNILSQEDEP
jgi:hypothetical protein